MSSIIYPTSSSSNLVIGVTAPSSGLGNETFIKRFELVLEQHKNNGIKVIEGHCLREDHWHVSANRKERAKDFLKLWDDPEISLIQPPWGGEILIDMLDLIDFEALKKKPKWVQGYSDISTLLFAITIKSGIATAHGTNFLDTLDGQDKLTSESRKYLSLTLGEEFIQTSSKKWQKEFVDFGSKLDTLFNLTETTEWKLLKGETAKISGRIIGGCLDTLMHLIGTPYGDLESFSSTFAKDEGLILYLENCEQSPCDLHRALISMKYAGWYDNLNGIVFGRNSGPDKDGFSYIESIKQVFEGSSFPVVLDADIGHKPPQMTIINGSLATIFIENGKAELKQKLC